MILFKTEKEVQVLIIGVYPPPLGGISVHIRRIFLRLKEAGVRVALLDYMRRWDDNVLPELHGLKGPFWRVGINLCQTRFKLSSDAIVHFHVSALGNFKWVGPFLLNAFSRYRRVITFHSGSLPKEIGNKSGKLYIRMIFRYLDRIIVVSDELKDFLTGCGLDPLRIHVIPAFLTETFDSSRLPIALRGIQPGVKVITTSGYLTPLYHYETLVEVIDRFSPELFRWVFAFYNIVDPDYSKPLLKKLEQLPQVIVLRDLAPEEFLAVLNRSDIYVRTTETDGDAVAIREALSLGKRVVATDVVRRPESCELYGLNDKEGLSQLLKRNGREERKSKINLEDNWSHLVAIYKDLQLKVENWV